jgi:hypothetical protein
LVQISGRNHRECIKNLRAGRNRESVAQLDMSASDCEWQLAEQYATQQRQDEGPDLS